jgi:hypothetical protein
MIAVQKGLAVLRKFHEDLLLWQSPDWGGSGFDPLFFSCEEGFPKATTSAIRLR